jgi:hypothetical protein
MTVEQSVRACKIASLDAVHSARLSVMNDIDRPQQWSAFVQRRHLIEYLGFTGRSRGAEALDQPGTQIIESEAEDVTVWPEFFGQSPDFEIGIDLDATGISID